MKKAREKPTYEELQRELEIYRAVGDNQGQLIHRYLADTTDIFVSRAFAEYFGKTADEMVGQKWIEVIPGHERENIRAYLASFTLENPISTYENEVDNLRGGERWTRWINEACFDDEGNITYFQSVGVDITDRKKAEEESEKLREMLEQAKRVQAVGTLAGGIAHNFNNLLMGIMAHVEMMRVTMDPNDPHQRRLAEIVNIVESGTDLGKHLMQYSQLKALEVAPVNLSDVVREVSKTFCELHKNIECRQELAEDLPMLEADRTELDQLVLNLLLNTADALPEGGDVFVATKKIAYEDMSGGPEGTMQGDCVLLTVRDAGVGMDEETKRQIFEPFFTTKSLAERTGLGLASVYNTVRNYNGRIEVHSEKGKGTAMEIYLSCERNQGAS